MAFKQYQMAEQALEHVGDQPFTLRSLASTIGMPAKVIEASVDRMRRGGLILTIGEGRPEGRRGRRVRLYRRTPVGRIGSLPEATRAFIQRVIVATRKLQNLYWFTVKELAEAGGFTRSERMTLPTTLKVLEREDMVWRTHGQDMQRRPNGVVVACWSANPGFIESEKAILAQVLATRARMGIQDAPPPRVGVLVFTSMPSLDRKDRWQRFLPAKPEPKSET